MLLTLTLQLPSLKVFYGLQYLMMAMKPEIYCLILCTYLKKKNWVVIDGIFFNLVFVYHNRMYKIKFKNGVAFWGGFMFCWICLVITWKFSVPAEWLDILSSAAIIVILVSLEI